MAVAPRQIRIEYTSKGNLTGLTNVKAQIYVNGVAKAVGGSAIVLSEVDATNAPGLYELIITTAMQTSYGITAAGENTISGYINSATFPAPAPFRVQSSFYNSDDTQATLGTPAGASVSADIAAIQTRLGSPAGASVSADIASIAAQNVTALAQLTALTNAAQSATGIAAALPGFEIGTSANTYVVPFTLTNAAGALVNSSTGMTVGLKNQAGTDRGSYLTGSSGSPATVTAANPSTGQYNVTIVIPANAPEEELILSTNYTVNGNAAVKYYIAQLTVDPLTSGYALQTTLLSVQTTVNMINSAVANATYGLSALQTLLANGTYGLSAIQSLLANGTYGLSALQSLLANGTYGLSALQSLISGTNTNVLAVQASVTAVQGSGFAAGTDDLHSLSTFIRANVYTGGRVA